jgi:N-acyl-D-amino-acid deacylase
MQYVLVNGQLELENGRHTGTRSGTPLYGPAYKQDEK